jgi:hypothetical protein
MLSLRPINKDGTWGGKQKKEYILDKDGNKMYDPKKRQYQCRSIPSTDWNDRGKADEWRAAWQDAVNAELERLGFDSRIDRRSYAEQGIEKIPTVHLGVAASQMEKRGIVTDRGNINREVRITNKQIRQLHARISYLEKWVAEEAVASKPPALADVISEILTRQGQSGLTRIKAASEVFNFMQKNEIYDMDALEKKVRVMRSNFNSVSEDLKKTERRIVTLKEHIRHSENYKNNRKHKARYDELYSLYTAALKATGFGAERKAQKALDAATAYYETHRSEIAMYDNAERYLRDVLQERFDPKKQPPVTRWRNDLAAKTTEKEALYQEYYALKEETAKVEKIKRSVTEILKSERPGQATERARGVAL